MYRSNVLLHCIHIITTTGALLECLLENDAGFSDSAGSGSRKKEDVENVRLTIDGEFIGHEADLYELHLVNILYIYNLNQSTV